MDVVIYNMMQQDVQDVVIPLTGRYSVTLGGYRDIIGSGSSRGYLRNSTHL